MDSAYCAGAHEGGFQVNRAVAGRAVVMDDLPVHGQIAGAVDLHRLRGGVHAELRGGGHKFERAAGRIGVLRDAVPVGVGGGGYGAAPHGVERR